MFGSDEAEAAQVDAFCEHIRDIREAYNKAIGNPFAPPSPEAEERKDAWFSVEMPKWSLAVCL